MAWNKVGGGQLEWKVVSGTSYQSSDDERNRTMYEYTGTEATPYIDASFEGTGWDYSTADGPELDVYYDDGTSEMYDLNTENTTSGSFSGYVTQVVWRLPDGSHGSQYDWCRINFTATLE